MKVPDELTKPKVEPIKEEELKVEMDAIPVPKLNLPPPESRLETDLITESDVIKGGFTPMNQYDVDKQLDAAPVLHSPSHVNDQTEQIQHFKEVIQGNHRQIEDL